VIQLENVTKHYRGGRGVSGLSFNIQEGEVFGYLGPNGAGKSTTIRMLMGFLRADSGTAKIQGLDCWKDASRIHEHVGYLPGEIGFLDDMNGIQFLNLIAGMRKLTRLTHRDELIRRLDFDVHTPIRKMSKGMKQKVGIVAAFMHEPDVLILDEPTSGLDPLMQQLFLDLVSESKSRGATVLMSSHVFAEVERVCDRVGIIRDGHLVAIEDVKKLRETQRKVFTVHLADIAQAAHLESAGYPVTKVSPSEVDVEVQGDYNSFLQALTGCDVQNLTMRELNLEEVFMHYYSTHEDAQRKSDEHAVAGT
jgi:ABC-2 type transport system ATP-binding protein